MKSGKIKYDTRCRGSTEFKRRVSYNEKKGYYVLREFTDGDKCQYNVQRSAAANPKWLAKKYQAVIMDQPNVK